MNANSFKIDAVIKNVSKKISRGREGTFVVRYLLVETIDGGEKYSQTIKMEASGKSVDIVDEGWIGKSVTINFSLKGFEWEGKNYITINVFSAIPIDREELEGSKRKNGGSPFGEDEKEEEEDDDIGF